MKRLSGLLLVAAMAFTPISALAANSRFKDVPSDAWYAPYVAQVDYEGLMKGYGNDTFGPNNLLTRAEVAKIIWSYWGSPAVEGEGFADAQGQWYQDAATYNKTRRIMTGYADGTFGGSNPISRQELMTILYRAWNKNHMSQMGAAGDGPFARYPDGDQVAEWASTPIQWGMAYGLFGNGDKLNPNGNTTRAEAAKMFAEWSNQMKIGYIEDKPDFLT